MDVLSGVLLNTRVLASTFGILDLGGPWGIAHSQDQPQVALGMSVLEGSCWFESESRPPTELRAGDTALALRGCTHRSTSSPSVQTISLDSFLADNGIARLVSGGASEMPREVRWGPGEERTRMLVFAVLVQDVGPVSAIAVLEPTILVRGSGAQPAPWVAAALGYLAAARTSGPGRVGVETKLGELVFASILREHVLTDPEAGDRWMRGRDVERIGRAVASMHDRPGYPWTVGRLAGVAGMARSSFARAFVQLQGQSPIEYLTGLRIDEACRRLAVHGQSVSSVAAASGYQSERAFRHAFVKQVGMPPTHYVRRFRGESGAGRTTTLGRRVLPSS